jgi:predicted ATPase
VVITVRDQDGRTRVVEARGAPAPRISTTLLPGPVGLLRIDGFAATDEETAELRAALESFERAGARGWIVDVRWCGGGFSIPLSRLLVDRGRLFSRQRHNEVHLPGGRVLAARQDIDADGTALPFQRPLAVLIGPGSISGAESFAGPMRALGRATLVGERTAGLCGLARARDLAPGWRITLATHETFLGPEEWRLNRIGVPPDVAVTRMGLHTGEAERLGGRYAGAPLYRCARLTATAHGGQVVLSGATAALVQDELPGGRLRDLGEHRLQDLARPERVHQLVHPGLPGEFPPLRSLDARPHNLPLQLTSFVGRERELGEVARRLGAARLVTLTGPGGVGKTRLALQAAAAAQEAHPDGVWLVELGGLADPSLVPQAVAAAAGVQEEPGRPLAAALADALRPKRLLLVLDNCEHLAGACARLAAALLLACPGVRVLATSRAPLGAGGEALSPVPPLGLPPAGDGAPGAPAPAPARLTQSEAVRLFAERAAAARPGFAVTAENAAAVARICRRLDGLPLALELAAARVRALAVGDVAALLEDRFRLLTGGSRAAPPRLRTLRAAVDWSHALLTAPERALFARLSVFAGGFSLAAAEAVGAESGPAVLGLLLGLVDQSLVVAEPLPDGTTRYRLLETLRQYAREALEASGGAEAARARHAAHFLAAVEAADAPPLGPAPAATAPLWGPEQAAVWRRLGAARDDLRAALGWLLERGDGAAGLRLALALAPFWRGYSQREGERWLEALLARGGGAPAALRAGATAAAGRLAAWRGDHARARALFEAAVPLAREQGDRRVLAAALGGLGQSVGAAGRPPGRAAALLGESLALHRELGDERGVAGALYALGMLAHFQGQPARAVAHLEEGLAHSRRLGLGAGLIDLGLFNLGLLAYLQGQPDRAEGLARQALALRRDLAQAVGKPVGKPGGIGVCLALLAGVASAQGRAGRAARLFGAAERGAESLQQKVVIPQYRDDYDRAVAAARARLGEDAFAAAWAAGRAMAPEDAVAYAMADAPGAA